MDIYYIYIKIVYLFIYLVLHLHIVMYYIDKEDYISILAMCIQNYLACFHCCYRHMGRARPHTVRHGGVSHGDLMRLWGLPKMGASPEPWVSRLK